METPAAPDFTVSYINNSLIGKFMFKVIQNGMNRVDIEMSGKLNAE